MNFRSRRNPREVWVWTWPDTAHPRMPATPTTMKPWPATLAANLPHRDREMVRDHPPERDPICLWIPRTRPVEALGGLQAWGPEPPLVDLPTDKHLLVLVLPHLVKPRLLPPTARVAHLLTLLWTEHLWLEGKFQVIFAHQRKKKTCLKITDFANFWENS